MMEQVAVVPYDVGEASLAEPECALRDGVEDRLRIRRGAGDHLKNRARRGQVTVARLQLFEQTHILDGDNRLIGEGRYQLDLLLGERLDFISVQTENTDKDSFSEHWDSQDRPIAANLLKLGRLVLG